MATVLALILSSTLWGAASAAPDSVLSFSTSFGSFSSASGLLITPQQWFYIFDADRNLLYRFRDPREEPLIVGGAGWDATSFDKPTGLASDGLNIFVADYGNHRISRFDRDLNFISSFSTRDTSFAPARFGYPGGIALSRSGEMVILDTENSRVMKFNAQHRFEREFGGINDLRGKVTQPLKILIDQSDRILVLEPNRLIIFDPWGNFIQTIEGPLFRDAVGFDTASDQIVVALKQQLLWYDERGAVRAAISISNLPELLPAESLRDVKMAGNALYLLTAGRVLKYRWLE
ncbi:MAG: NHL repeat-containing protein [bacterium]